MVWYTKCVFLKKRIVTLDLFKRVFTIFEFREFLFQDWLPNPGYFSLDEERTNRFIAMLKTLARSEFTEIVPTISVNSPTNSNLKPKHLSGNLKEFW